MGKILSFAVDFGSYALKGGAKYYAWLGFLSIFVLVGLYTGYRQLTEGLILIGATDQISWELFIANFIFTAHVAAAAILVVAPGYMYNNKEFKELSVLGEVIALCFVATGIMFILFHMGRPDRLWHMLPLIGVFNIPNSMLVYDVIVLNVYLILNLVAVAYTLYKKYHGEVAFAGWYKPLIYLAICWGPLIHICTSFVLSSNARMAAWATAVLPFAFLSMAGASGPALIILIFLLIRKYTKLQISDSVIDTLTTMIIWSLGILMLVFGAEFFTAMYSSAHHSEALYFSIFGHNGLNDYVPWFWGIMITLVACLFVLLIPAVRRGYNFWLPLVCAVVFLVILIEKPMFLVFPAFSPSPFGEYTVYKATFIEYANIMLVWSIGFIALTLIMKGAVGILTGEVKYAKVRK